MQYFQKGDIIVAVTPDRRKLAFRKSRKGFEQLMTADGIHNIGEFSEIAERDMPKALRAKALALSVYGPGKCNLRIVYLVNIGYFKICGNDAERIEELQGQMLHLATTLTNTNTERDSIVVKGVFVDRAS